MKMHISTLSKIYPQQSPVSFFGCCIRNYNDVLAIGARCGSPYDPVGPGFVDVYINGQYSQTLQGEAHGERFGVSIALNEQYLCIGAYRENTGAESGGSVYVYKRNGNKYGLLNLLYAPDKRHKDYFAYNIAIEGKTLVIGAYAKNIIGGEDGKAYVFDLDHNKCVSEISNIHPIINENFGRAVCIYDNKIYIGSHKRNKKGSIYEYDSNGNLLNIFEHPNTKGFGNSIYVDADYVITGAYESQDNGSVCIYDKKLNKWKNITIDGNGSFFGGSISVSKNIIAIGSYRYGQKERGAVFLYNITENKIIDKIIPEIGTAWFGYSVHLNKNKLFVGSVKENLVYTYALN